MLPNSLRIVTILKPFAIHQSNSLQCPNGILLFGMILLFQQNGIQIFNWNITNLYNEYNKKTYGPRFRRLCHALPKILFPKKRSMQSRKQVVELWMTSGHNSDNIVQLEQWWPTFHKMFGIFQIVHGPSNIPMKLRQIKRDNFYSFQIEKCIYKIDTIG